MRKKAADLRQHRRPAWYALDGKITQRLMVATLLVRLEPKPDLCVATRRFMRLFFKVRDVGFRATAIAQVSVRE